MQNPACRGRRFRGQASRELDERAWSVLAHDIQHLEPITPCVTTAEGRLAVDFVVR